MRGTLTERYWDKVVQSEPCWSWRGATVQGYGILGKGAKGRGTVRVHRVSWELHFGPIPKGVFVLHKCDNPPCSKPSHLFLGDQRANMHDASVKGRLRGKRGDIRGGLNPNAKVTHAQVVDIRRRYREGGVSQQSLANEYGVGQNQISRIIRGESWS